MRHLEITAYEVIKLKRDPGDPRGGYLRLALGSGTQVGSTWTRLATYVRGYMKHAESRED